MKTKETILKVESSGETLYMTKEAYGHYRLTLSTGDFHTHKAKELKRLPKGVQPRSVQQAEDINPRINYPTVESIIEAYNAEDEFAEAYAESEDSPLAEFVSSFFYGEAAFSQILDAARLEEETADLLKRFHEAKGLKATHGLLESVSELRLADMYYQDGEILSVTIGEQEHQVDDRLSNAFQTLTDDEKARVIKETSAGIFSNSRNDGRFIYTSHDYSRWVMVADEAKLVRKLKRELKAIKAKPALKIVKGA